MRIKKSLQYAHISTYKSPLPSVAFATHPRLTEQPATGNKNKNNNISSKTKNIEKQKGLN